MVKPEIGLVVHYREVVVVMGELLLDWLVMVSKFCCCWHLIRLSVDFVVFGVVY
jgi:hypothetical protein